MITIETNKTDEQVLVAMTGSLDTVAAEQVDAQVKEIEAEASLPVVIECQKLEYIASAGLRLLLRIAKAAKANDQKVTLLNVNTNIKEVLSITHFDKMFIVNP